MGADGFVVGALSHELITAGNFDDLEAVLVEVITIFDVFDGLQHHLLGEAHAEVFEEHVLQLFDGDGVGRGEDQGLDVLGEVLHRDAKVEIRNQDSEIRNQTADFRELIENEFSLL